MFQYLAMWDQFIKHPSAYCRPFMDFTKKWTADEICFFTDASRNFSLGCVEDTVKQPGFNVDGRMKLRS